LIDDDRCEAAVAVGIASGVVIGDAVGVDAAVGSIAGCLALTQAFRLTVIRIRLMKMGRVARFI
jgi:urease accessory protein UreH